MTEFTDRVFVIAEAGVNHNGDPDLAFKLVDAAVDAGANAVKFQTFKAEKAVSNNAPKADYQRTSISPDETQREMLRHLELSPLLHPQLIQYCRKRGIRFMSSPFDLESASFLISNLGLKALKLGSGELVFAPMLLQAARAGCDLCVSTGMSTIDEIRDALGVLAFGFVGGDEPPSRNGFQRAFASPAGQMALKEKVTLLHCTTAYPTPAKDANVRAMLHIKDVFGLRVGYSDHTLSGVASLAAVALGASVIEKHFTLDRHLPGPDQASSSTPEELQTLVALIREMEEVLGDANKAPTHSEMMMRPIVRKSLVAAANIEEGALFNVENLAIMRPGVGANPMSYWDLLGCQAHRSYVQGEPIDGDEET